MACQPAAHASLQRPRASIPALKNEAQSRLNRSRLLHPNLPARPLQAQICPKDSAAQLWSQCIRTRALAIAIVRYMPTA